MENWLTQTQKEFKTELKGKQVTIIGHTRHTAAKQARTLLHNIGIETSHKPKKDRHTLTILIYNKKTSTS